MNIKNVHLVFKILIFISSLLYFTSCKQNDFVEKIVPTAVDISEGHSALLKNQSEKHEEPQTLRNLKIIKSANVRFKVKKVRAATKSIKKITSDYDGYISDLRFENNPYSLENRFTIKVPCQYFDAMMDSIIKVAEFVDYENVTTEDITEQYVDLQSRLKTKLEVRTRYESILRKKAKTVEEILSTEEKIRVLQEEIEAAQGKLQYMTNRVAYSTIQIDLYETVDYKEEPESYTKTFWAKSKDGLTFGWSLLEAIFVGLIYIWPLLIIGAPVIFLIQRSLSKRKKKD